MPFPFAGKTPLNLALQGGGAHGAFTWGVLDALLEDGRFDIEGISGTSAGAMNAAILAHGLASGGRDGARVALAGFWEAVAAASPFGGSDDTGAMAPALRLALQWTEHLAPAQINPLDINPLRDIVNEHIDFERLRGERRLRLFIAATHAATGKLRIFHNHELSAEVLLASACLPVLHHTVTIDGEPYWDGGYSANPAVFPLFWECAAADTLLVLLSPLHFGPAPTDAAGIRQRLQEIAFNNTFLREMRMFAHLADEAGKLRRPWWLPRRISTGDLADRVRGRRFHALTTAAVLDTLPAGSRLTASRAFLHRLRDAGRAQAGTWLAGPAAAVGKRHGVDLAELFY